MQSVTFNAGAGEFVESTDGSFGGHSNGIGQGGGCLPTPLIRNTSVKYEINLGETGEKGLKVTRRGEVSASDLGMQSQGILSTATNQGTPVRHVSEVNDNTLVRVNGMEMTAKTAALHGYLNLNRDGSYGNPPEALAPTVDDVKVEQGQEPQTVYDQEMFNPEIESALESVSKDLGGYEALDRHALSSIAGLSQGNISGAVRGLAAATEATPAEAEALIMGVQERYSKHSADYITKTHQLDGEAVLEWAGNTMSPREKAQAYQQIYMGRKGVLDSMVEKYKVHLRRNFKP